MTIDLDSLSIPELCALAMDTVYPYRIVFYPRTKEEGDAISAYMRKRFASADFRVSDVVIKGEEARKRVGLIPIWEN